MLAYAANRPTIAQRPSSPATMLLVISAHVALLAVVMSTKMDLPARIRPEITRIFFPPKPTDPPPTAVQERKTKSVRERQIDDPDQRVPIPPPHGDATGTTDPNPDQGVIGGGGQAYPPNPIPVPTPVRHQAQLLTPASDLRPPYPPSKLLNEEEAVVTLRLTIDEHGRVIEVQPVGKADPIFLAAARHHLMAHWRYQPASVDGSPVGSSQVITLRFQLDE